MSSLLNTLIETIVKDLADIELIEENKFKRKECNLLLKRIDVAKNLVGDDAKLVLDLENLEKKTRSLLK